MHSRLLVSVWLLPRKPLNSLVNRYDASVSSWPEPYHATASAPGCFERITQAVGDLRDRLGPTSPPAAGRPSRRGSSAWSADAPVVGLEQERALGAHHAEVRGASGRRGSTASPRPGPSRPRRSPRRSTGRSRAWSAAVPAKASGFGMTVSEAMVPFIPSKGRPPRTRSTTTVGQANA